MLILLPPSEGKHSPARGKPLDLASLSFPELTEPRSAVLEEVVRRCRDEPDAMAQVLALGPSQAAEVARNAGLPRAATARADRIYTGVLYDALDLPGLDADARRRAARRVLVMSALFGVVRPADRIPAYRLSGQTRLPGLGVVARHWSRHLGGPLDQAAGGGLVVDLRSTAYAGFWRPSRTDRVVTVRVLHEQDGRRSVVSHSNKATKGRLVRDLLRHGGSPGSPAGFADLLGDLGWRVEAGGDGRLDVVVAAL